MVTNVPVSYSNGLGIYSNCSEYQCLCLRSGPSTSKCVLCLPLLSLDYLVNYLLVPNTIAHECKQTEYGTASPKLG